VPRNPIHLKPGTANTIVRNTGLSSVITDAELLHEARSQDYFVETDEQLLVKLHAAQRRLSGAARGGLRAAAKKKRNKEIDAAAMAQLLKEIRTLASQELPFAGDEEWARIIEKRTAEAKTPLDLADLRRDLIRTSERHRGENS